MHQSLIRFSCQCLLSAFVYPKAPIMGERAKRDETHGSSILTTLVTVIYSTMRGKFSTCPATASPSARREVANQSCKQIWNAAIGVGPWCAASDAPSVVQNVTDITLVRSRNPVSQNIPVSPRSYEFGEDTGKKRSCNNSITEAKEQKWLNSWASAWEYKELNVS